jgi:glyoxylase I family protein
MSSGPIFVEAAMPTFGRALHMALTATDMRVSADWYACVLGFDFVKEFEVDPGDAGIPRILLLHQHSGFLLGLCNHAGQTGDSFDPLRTGLDHVAFEVADRAVDSWIARLDHPAVCPILRCGSWATRLSCPCRTLTGFRSSCG